MAWAHLWENIRERIDAERPRSITLAVSESPVDDRNSAEPPQAMVVGDRVR